MHTYVEYVVFFIQLKPCLTHSFIIFHFTLYNGHSNILKYSSQTERLMAAVLYALVILYINNIALSILVYEIRCIFLFMHFDMFVKVKLLGQKNKHCYGSLHINRLPS